MSICSAKNRIRISQQSLYSKIAGAGGFDCYTLWAIVKAIEAGVKVDIVVSNDVSLSDGGYTGGLFTVLTALTSMYVGLRKKIFAPPIDPPRHYLAEWAEASLKSPTYELPIVVRHKSWNSDEYNPYLNELNERLSVAQLYHSPQVNYWKVGAEQKPAGNHAKVYIIDDTHFYVGSDNMYLSGTSHGLQEYGYLIEGQSETRDFIAKYWDRLWKNSSQAVVKAGKNNISFVT